jgi:type II secretory pathway pseudopilin PulG
MRRHTNHLTDARAGFTLVEAAIATALLVLLMTSAILAAKRGQGAFRAAQDATDVETHIRRALDRAAIELLSVGEEELLPNPTGQVGASSILFRQARSWDGNAGDGVNGLNVLWGDQNRLAFEYETGESNDGVDEDGDGLVDEGCLVLTRDVGGNERRVVLCSGVREFLEDEIANGVDDNDNDKDGVVNGAGDLVDEAGFNVHRVGDVLYLRLSLEVPCETGSIVRTLETSVRLRN